MSKRDLQQRLRRALIGPPSIPRAELEERLQARSTVPNLESIKVASDALSKMLDRQFDAIESADAKAQLLLTAVLGLGILKSDLLQPPTSTSLRVVFGLTVGAGLGAVVAALSVLRARTMLAGPGAIATAEATHYDELALSQSIVDSNAVAVQTNQNVLESKSRRLNWSILLATVAVLGFFLLAFAGASDMTNSNQSGSSQSPSTATSSPTVPGSQPPAEPGKPSSEPSAVAPSEAGQAFVHPRLGEAELRKGTDLATDKIPGPDPTE